MIEFIKEIASKVILFFATGLMTVAGTISPSPTPSPTPPPIVIVSPTPSPSPKTQPSVKPKIISPTLFINPTSIPSIPVPTPTIDKEDINRACINEDRILDQIKDACGSVPFPGIDECIQMRINRAEVELKESNLERANKMKELKPQYLEQKTKCETQI